MTATQQIKNALITYLGGCGLTGVSIVDALQRAEFILPILAVDLPSVAAFDQTLPMVHSAEVTITLRAHSGDEAEDDVDSWVDVVESALHDRSALTDILSSAGIKVYDWTYDGSTEEWDDAILHVTFAAKCVVERIS
jgi:hypothetical protein